MAKNIELMGAVFPDVPSIKLPQYGGGLVNFDDTSDGDIQPDDVAQGKIGYAQGQKVVGTAVAPTGSQTFTENGTYDVTALAEAVINVAGGGGLEYETGSFEPSSTVNNMTVNWTNTHDKAPMFVLIYDELETSAATNSMLASVYVSFGAKLWNIAYGFYYMLYRTTSTQSTQSTFRYDENVTSQTSAVGYFLSKTRVRFRPDIMSGIKLIQGHTYKWIAVWAPTE